LDFKIIGSHYGHGYRELSHFPVHPETAHLYFPQGNRLQSKLKFLLPVATDGNLLCKVGVGQDLQGEHIVPGRTFNSEFSVTIRYGMIGTINGRIHRKQLGHHILNGLIICVI